MTQGNRLQNELNEIISTAAGTGTVEVEAPSTGIIEAATMALRDNLGASSSTGASTRGIALSTLFTLLTGRSHSVVSLGTEIEQLRARVTVLERELSELKDSLTEEQIIVLRSISREQAKQEILGLFQAGETLFFSDIAKRLQIDLPLVVEICQELRDEGEIEVDADAV